MTTSSSSPSINFLLMSPRIRGSVVQRQITPRTASSDLQSSGGNLRQQKVTSSSNSSLPGPTSRPLQSSRTPRYVVLLLRGCELLLFLFWFQFEHHHVGIRKTVITHQSASKRHSAFVSHREQISQNDQISRSKVSIFRFREGDNFPLFFLLAARNWTECLCLVVFLFCP